MIMMEENTNIYKGGGYGYGGSSFLETIVALKTLEGGNCCHQTVIAEPSNSQVVANVLDSVSEKFERHNFKVDLLADKICDIKKEIADSNTTIITALKDRELRDIERELNRTERREILLAVAGSGSKKED